MPKENIYSQLEPEGPWQGESVSDTETRILKRLITEILPAMIGWAENKDSLTQMALKETLKDKSNFSRAEQEDWKNILEEFLKINIEVIILSSPIEFEGLMRPSHNKGSWKKNALAQRQKDLLESRAIEDTIVIGWHRSHGAIASLITEGQNTNLKKITSSWFPELHRSLQWKVDKEISPVREDLYIKFWSWDRKNFIFE
jgi:hypothetical protein